MSAAKGPPFGGHGVLLSGPNGVGKSAVGLQAFLCCQALGHFAVYIQDSKGWVDAAEQAGGRGDMFFLERLFWQNAHLIAAHPPLRAVFANRLRGAPVNDAMMDELRQVLARGEATVAVIVDDVQRITTAIAKGEEAGAPADLQKFARYFFNNWSSWNTENWCFVRLDIASSHGTRDLKLPSGDAHRLRFALPWPLDIARAALKHAKSPIFVKWSGAHNRIIHTAGGVIRSIMQCIEALSPRKDNASLDAMEKHLRERMREDCLDWLTNLDEKSRLEAIRNITPLLRGQLTWVDVKGAYDYGLVAFVAPSVPVQDKNVIPVSPVAASVLHQQMSAVRRRLKAPSLSTIQGDSERGYELERQLLCRLDPIKLDVSSVLLDGKFGPSFSLHVDHAMIYDTYEETATSTDMHVLYIPRSTQSSCDAIIVPASPANPSDEIAPLLVLEVSVTDPRTPKRVNKISKWFDQGELIDQLKAAHPHRSITIVLFWNGTLSSEPTKHQNVKAHQQRATEEGINILVVHGAGLSTLDVQL